MPKDATVSIELNSGVFGMGKHNIKYVLTSFWGHLYLYSE
jgi:hypothetical protein